MNKLEPGQQVIAVYRIDPSVAYIFGYGTYGYSPIYKHPCAWIGDVMILGHEAWFGPADDVQNLIGARKIITVSIHDYRKEQ